MRRAAAIAILAASAILAGCGTLPDGRIWGADATWRPGMTRIRDAAVGAARDPYVWAPLAGAAVVQIDDWDERISDWAREHTPVFGSQADAERWSDDLRDASVLAHWATILATPGGDDPGQWLVAKAKGGLVSAAAVASTVAITRGLKTTVDRDRPNGEDDESFPSGHTSSSAVHTRLASRNLRFMPIGAATRRTLDAGLAALTVGTSWARIEAGYHFPSDTLFSVALGNFIGSFVNDAFLGSGPGDASVAMQPLPGGAMLEVRVGF
ncbi:MAG TPA: phosphatase PAP2 family protein [Burkholderiales bacterium]|nr:phosphatase PAP2 family protein [Burkholderiales bacterium]